MSKDRDDMTPEERCREIAEILARGYLRMLAKEAKGAPERPKGSESRAVENLSESPPFPLEDVRTPGPDVVTLEENGEAR